MIVNTNKEIKLKLKSFDHFQLDRVGSQIVLALSRVGAKYSGPIPLPRKIKKYTVNRSPHVHKKSREQFEIRSYCLLIIIESSPQAVDSLMKLDNLASGVEIEIKINGG